ncbi:hypothetical protein BBUCA112A_J0012 (plasmid) [Borreliella burgdorferi CA-11.2A]|nr:hypothetical protein BBUCA112A_J0012 [Borreliella burgdorferi CA-11.2A]
MVHTTGFTSRSSSCPEYYILLELARTLPHAVLTIILIIISLLLPSFTLILRNRLINSLDFSGPKLKKLI